MSKERALVILKPGVLQRHLVGEVIKRLEMASLKIIGMKLLQMTTQLAEQQYAEHKGKVFYEPLIEYMTSAPVIVMVIEGESAIRVIRKLAGATNPLEALPGTIRGDLALTTKKNVIHASDSPESAAREISIFFKEEEIINYELQNEQWVI